MNDTKQALEAVVGLVEKATPGEWAQSHRETATGGYSTEVYDEAGRAIAWMAWHEKPPRFEDGKRIVSTDRPENAEAIVAAVNLLARHGPALLAALEDARRYRTVRSAVYRDNVEIGEARLILRVTGACPDEREFDAAIDAMAAGGESC